jgi:predicted PhzF superfamily epimerase YddE/YHI9
VVDSFANIDVPGSGNPAAVVMMRSCIEESAEEINKWMLVVAKEFNISETAFVWPHEEHKQGREIHWNIRYFTPKMEIDLCGHATLAAAGILYRTLSVKNTNDTLLVFHANKDILTTQLPPGGLRSMKKRPTTKIAMKFPAKMPMEITESAQIEIVHRMLWEAFKVPSDVILFMGLSDIGDIFVELTTEAFAKIGYDEEIQYSALIMEFEGYTRGLVVTCSAPQPVVEADDGSATSSGAENGDAQPLDFLSRFFAPKAGINEDPATGSAHCALGPYYSKKLGREKVLGKQMSERGGVLECLVENESHVTLTGIAVQTMTGSLLL